MKHRTLLQRMRRKKIIDFYTELAIIFLLATFLAFILIQGV